MGNVVDLSQGAKTLCTLDNCTPDALLSMVERYGSARFGYIVTPNADHLVRLSEEADFRTYYSAAELTCLDSRVVARFIQLFKGVRVPVCTGSDLVASLFRVVIKPDDRIVLIGAPEQQAARLRELFGLRNLAHYNPPMGFANKPDAVETCLRFVEANSPFRYCLLAVGSPRQEMLAYRLRERGTARGLALCIGASIDFLTGGEKRAPKWVQKLNMEWAYRLLQNPRRMAHRYFVRSPRMIGLVFSRALPLRQPQLTSE